MSWFYLSLVYLDNDNCDLLLIIICHTLKHSATYDVQGVKLNGGGRNISIQCVFASGSQARGCHVEIRNSSIQMNIMRSDNPLSYTAEQTIGGLTPGSYEVFVFDWESDDTFPSVPSYVGHVNVTERTISTTSFPQTTTGRSMWLDSCSWLWVAIY